MFHLARILLLLLLSSMAYAQEEGSTIEVEILQIDNEKGQIRIGLYDSEESWLKKPKKGLLGKIVDGKSSAVFVNIPNGTYAISVYHDEDNDGELDSILGIPTEDTGSSNNAPARFGPPKWEVANFEVKGRSLQKIINL